MIDHQTHCASKISFYLSIPVIAGASFLGFKDLYKETTDFNSMILLTVLLSYFFSYFTIKYFLIFVRNFHLLIQNLLVFLLMINLHFNINESLPIKSYNVRARLLMQVLIC